MHWPENRSSTKQLFSMPPTITLPQILNSSHATMACHPVAKALLSEALLIDRDNQRTVRQQRISFTVVLYDATTSIECKVKYNLISVPKN